MTGHLAGEQAVLANPPRPTLSRAILRNSLLVSIGGGAIRLPSFLYTLYVVRTLGQVGYGQYATVIAFGGLFAIFFELGTTQYVERTIAQDRSRVGELFWQLVMVRLVLSILAMVALTTAAIAIGYERIVVLGIALQTITYIFAAMLTPLTAIFSSHERYDIWTGALALGQLLTMALGVLALRFGYGLLGLMIVGLIAMPIQIVVCAATVRHLWPGSLRFRFDLADTPGFLRASLPFGLSALALTVSFNADTFLLSLHYPSQIVGWYGAAYRLVPTLVSLLGGFLTVITPSLASRYHSEPEAVMSWVRSSIRGLALFGLPVAVGTCLLAPQIVSLLYGTSYGPSAAALALLAWDVPLRLFNAFAGNVAAAVNLERISWSVFATGSLTGLLLYLIAIPLFGITGAAAITVFADGLTATIFFWIFCRHLKVARVLWPLGRTGLAALLMGAIVWLAARRFGLVPTITIGATTYAAMALAFGLIDRSLLERLAHRLQRASIGAMR